MNWKVNKRILEKIDARNERQDMGENENSL